MFHCARVFSSLFVIASAALTSLSASAQVGQAQDFTIHQHWLSVRALGMGNAFTGLADDYNALLYNPAGLSRLEEGQINLGIGASLDSKAKKFYDDLSSASSSQDATDMTNFLQDNYGKHYSLRLPTLSAFWARPKWALGIILTDPDIQMEAHQGASPMLNLIATQDTTIAYGRGWEVNWGEDRVSLGVTAKAIYRAYFNRAFIAADFIGNSSVLRSSDAQEGLGLDADFGLLWSGRDKPQDVWRFTRPVVGFTVRNVIDSGFNSNMHLIDKNSSGKPPKMGRRYDVGTLWQLPDWSIFKTRGMLDVRDMGHDNWSFRKGLHVGFEFLWKIRSWWQGGWRVGLNQGYFTAGFTGKIGIFNLDLATYAEETGPTDTPNASRRYALKASMDW